MKSTSLRSIVMVVMLSACCEGYSTLQKAVDHAGDHCPPGQVADSFDVIQTGSSCFEVNNVRCSGLIGGTPPIIDTIPPPGV